MVSPEVEIGDLLRKIQDKAGRMLRIGTVESASGGRIADRLTNVPGSSHYLIGSVVAYSNEVKTGLIGVGKDTLDRHGAVSRETAIEMAEGGRRLLKLDICVSDTGIAGPEGAVPRKPVGLFYIGLSAEGVTRVAKHVFGGDREANKREAAEMALIMLRDFLRERLEKVGRPPETHVVTSFLERDGKILILKRSNKVGSYRGRWAGVSGYMEREAGVQARKEIREETGLGARDIRLIRAGDPLPMNDSIVGKRWVIHPFLFRVRPGAQIRLDWEHTGSRWIDPGQLGRFRTVPGLKDALERVME